ncbi:BQ5605_C025g10034 [Microbotryum silenes-dioicae]|uniref:BQ5605_C025g10034 protein n=1 Tax=Microbotryum silenes-dioicae TaxID=796604 RepID=A0A2X0MR19_9BASI|nr:BQ5605_C025g10034 [Microbotryum silenes-dioicae]
MAGKLACLLVRAFDRSLHTRVARVAPWPHKTTDAERAEAALARHENPRQTTGHALAGPVVRPLCRTHSRPPSLQQLIVFYPLERQVPTPPKHSFSTYRLGKRAPTRAPN